MYIYGGFFACKCWKSLGCMGGVYGVSLGELFVFPTRLLVSLTARYGSCVSSCMFSVFDK